MPKDDSCKKAATNSPPDGTASEMPKNSFFSFYGAKVTRTTSSAVSTSKTPNFSFGASIAKKDDSKNTNDEKISEGASQTSSALSFGSSSGSTNNSNLLTKNSDKEKESSLVAGSESTSLFSIGKSNGSDEKPTSQLPKYI